MMLHRSISIKSEEEYQAFLAQLPKYRGLRGRFTTFTITGTVHAEELKDFETALNLKKRRARTRRKSAARMSRAGS